MSKKIKQNNILETTILNIEGNLWTVRDACTGVMVFGQTGSGKTSGILDNIRNKYLELGFGGVVFCAKPDECHEWKQAIKKANRENDVLYLTQETFNYLDHEARRTGTGGGQIENIVNLYLEVVNITKDKSQKGGSSDEYWQNAVKQMLRNSITLLKMVGLSINLQNIAKLILSAPSPNDTGDVTSKDAFCEDLLLVNTSFAQRESSEYKLAYAYFLEEFANLDQRTRTNTISSFSVVADIMQRGELERCFSAEKSTLNLDDIYKKGKILIVDQNVKEYGQIGKYSAAIIKYCFCKMIERRIDISDSEAPPVFLWADECQNFFIENDLDFQTTARSSRTLTTYATQNLGNLQAGYGKEKAASILGNLGTKFFCQNGEFDTNEWASKSIGQEIVRRRSQNIGDSKSTSIKGDGNKSDSYSEGWSEQKDYKIEPSVFSSLQGGGPRGQCKVGFVFWQSGRILNNGNTFILSTMRQQCKLICGAKRYRQCPVVPEVGKGTYLGEKKYLLLEDKMNFIGIFISATVVGMGYYLIYFQEDILFFCYKDFYFTVASLCFSVLGLVLFFIWKVLFELPAILKGLKTGHREKLKKIQGLPWHDAHVYFFLGNLVFALFFQKNIYTKTENFILVFLWFFWTLLYIIMKSTGTKKVK